uniref:hypothetical protein n=1 Tax=Mycobacterium tuberculosis TaxID=1773 RepID=UPI00254E4A66
LAPFVASYKNFKADACVWYAGKSICPETNSFWWDHALDDTETQRLKWVRKNYMIYNYCHDYKRFPQGFPPECSNEISP